MHYEVEDGGDAKLPDTCDQIHAIILAKGDKDVIHG